MSNLFCEKPLALGSSELAVLFLKRLAISAIITSILSFGSPVEWEELIAPEGDKEKRKAEESLEEHAELLEEDKKLFRFKGWGLRKDVDELLDELLEVGKEPLEESRLIELINIPIVVFLVIAHSSTL